MSAGTTYYASLGNTAHIVNLIIAISFAILVVWFGNNDNSSNNDDDNENTTITLFDTDWKRHGFCVTNFNVPYMNSHDACFYFDTIMAVILTGVYILVRNTPGLENANKHIIAHIIGMFVHGIGHEGVAIGIRSSEYNIDVSIQESNRTILERFNENSIQTFIMEEILGIIFWFGLLYTAMPESKWNRIIIIVFISRLGQTYISSQFGFTYVQTILAIAYSFNQLSYSKKDKNTFEYALQPLLVAVPTTITGWIESTQCQAFVKEKLYGHLIYDGYIAISITVWYFLCYLHCRDENDITATKKKST